MQYMVQYVDFCICMDLSRFVWKYVPMLFDTNAAPEEHV